MTSNTFDSLRAEMRQACGWEQMPSAAAIAALAKLCGPAEIDHLIRDLDALDDADLEGDAGDRADEYWRLRRAYGQVLGAIGAPAVEPLLRALASENPETGGVAARALAIIGTPRAFAPIVARVTESAGGSPPLVSIEALGLLRDARAIPVLLPFLAATGQNRAWTIRVAANALGEIGTPEVIPPLASVLADDPEWFARVGAAEGLRKVRHKDAVAALRRAREDPDPRVREEAIAGSR